LISFDATALGLKGQNQKICQLLNVFGLTFIAEHIIFNVIEKEQKRWIK